MAHCGRGPGRPGSGYRGRRRPGAVPSEIRDRSAGFGPRVEHVPAVIDRVAGGYRSPGDFRWQRAKLWREPLPEVVTRARPEQLLGYLAALW
jgi:hypothetical protein